MPTSIVVNIKIFSFSVIIFMLEIECAVQKKVLLVSLTLDQKKLINLSLTVNKRNEINQCVCFLILNMTRFFFFTITYFLINILF